MSKKNKPGLLLQVGRTPEGRSIWHGVYAFYETHGLPLSDLLFQLWSKDGMPDWEQLVFDMHSAGRPFPRCIEAVCAAVTDACYPLEIRDRIVARVQKMETAL